MRDLNIDFLDLYKRADRFIKDAYHSYEGVSEYIRLMESCYNRGSVKVHGWRDDYDRLKRARWIRNQLSHDVDFDCDICSESDYEWFEDFYNRLFSSSDPLALLGRMESGAKRKQAENRSADTAKSLTETRPAAIPKFTAPQTVKAPYSQQNKAKNKKAGKQAEGCIFTFLLLSMLFILAFIIILLFFQIG
ncbi:MAG: hypothetical protein Q4A05_11110 [Ruminococcus sp.]|nr:hypothetical protein [Ruminococcus sp.]